MAVQDSPAVEWDSNQMAVLKRRYLKKEGSSYESPESMFHRVAHNLSQAEWNYEGASTDKVDFWEEQFYQVMSQLLFLPNSPTLMNAGRDLQQLSACFVLPVEDSIEDIFEAVKRTALIHQSGGGTGFFFGRLRQEGSLVKSTSGIASGPCSFITAFDAATEVVKQGGTRRGANMGILNVDHPDILKFIELKRSGGLQNFNISVSVTKDFMEAVYTNSFYTIHDPRTGKVLDNYSARRVFELICEAAWATGDPGLWFVDRVNSTHWDPQLGRIESCNPCGEQELLPFESCNLGSLNLVRLTSPEELERVVKVAVRLLDDVIDMNSYPLPEIEAMSKLTRRIGLGVMGWADHLIELRIPYDSQEALDRGRVISGTVQRLTHEASVGLAKERGPYPAWSSKFSKSPIPIRNTSPVTIAPTGTISMIAGVSSGIEPIFAPAFLKTVMDKTPLPYVHPLLRSHLTEEEEVETARRGSVQWIPDLSQGIKDLFKGAGEIPWKAHIEMQAAWQSHTDNAVSKTINLPPEATVEDVKEAYLLAYDKGCKGITIYRDGSKTSFG